MTDSEFQPNKQNGDDDIDISPRSVSKLTKKYEKRSMSMHDGIAIWCDCCSCEAEPYWAELADEMGVDLGSDYEDSDLD